MNEVKERVIEALFERGEWTRKVNPTEYRTRCPYCGDSSKNQNTGHLYIHINVEDNLPMVYHCFKCEEQGIITKDVLSALDISDVNLHAMVSSFNKSADRFRSMRYLAGEETLMFPYERPEVTKNEKTEYIEKRLGTSLTIEELTKMKVVTSLREFLLKNEIKTLTCDPYWANKIEDHYVGFLTFGSSYLLFRDITEKEELKWLKYPITEESRRTRSFYSMETTVDVFTKNSIEINLAEGVLDVLSFSKNLGFWSPNSLNIAVSGKNYDSILHKIISLGFLGSNVSLNIFADNDDTFNKKSVNPTTIEYFEKHLSKMKYLFHSTTIYYNTIGKDFGVPKDRIKIKKHKLY